VKAIGGTAGDLPGAPPAKAMRRAPAARRIVDALRSSEEQLWRWTARVAVVLPSGRPRLRITVLAIKAYPAIIVNGWSFLTGRRGPTGSSYGATVHTHGVAHPMGSSFGAWPLILGTIQTSAVAVVIALPISIGAAFALTERLPRWVSQPLGFAVELLAGFPSVIIGLWGILTFGPFLADTSIPTSPTTCPTCRCSATSATPSGTAKGCSPRASCSRS